MGKQKGTKMKTTLMLLIALSLSAGSISGLSNNGTGGLPKRFKPKKTECPKGQKLVIKMYKPKAYMEERELSRKCVNVSEWE